MTALETLKCYTHGKKNTDKVEISVWALNRIINALSQECVNPTQKHVGNALDMRCDDTSIEWYDLEGYVGSSEK